MPQLSDTMDSGKILNWSKKEGDKVQRGDILAEVETDKANLEIESFHEGVLLKILTPADESADVGEIIAYIGEQGEEVSDASSSSASKSSNQQEAADNTNAPAPIEQKNSEPVTIETPQHQNGHAAPQVSGDAGGRIKASPLAKKLAEQKNIDLSSLSGSGPDGRIIKRDLESAAPAQAATSQPAPVAAAAATPAKAPTSPTAMNFSGEGSITPMSKMRATIGKRMQQSVVEAPHFYVTTSVCMDEAIKLRTLLKEKGGYEGVSFNHFIMKAVAYGLAHEPRVNCSVKEDNSIYDAGQVNIGIITALPDGLIIPVLHNVTALTLKDVVFESRALIDRARAGRPTSQDLSGGTFSISNLGMFDVESFTAIINPGQGAILAVSSILEQPVVKDGAVVPGNVMKATVSVDHRIIDGVMAGTFLKYFKEGLENPALLMI